MDEELFKSLVNNVGWPAAAIFGMLTIMYRLGSRAVNHHIRFLKFLRRSIEQLIATQKEIPAKLEHVCRYPAAQEESKPCEKQ